MIVIRLDGNPVAKGRPRFNRATGAAYTPEKTARYEDRLALAAQHVMAGRPLLEGPLKIHFDAYMEIPRSKSQRWKIQAMAGIIRPTGKPDWENLAKTIDALNRIVWVDDSQIVDAVVRKYYSDRPRVEIVVDKMSTTA